MKQMIRDQETEDIQKREQQRAAQRRYQQELDSQLNELRQRSIDSLQSKLRLCIKLFLLFLFFPF
jgi:Skp family chaperone for outer membrane proteins